MYPALCVLAAVAIDGANSVQLLERIAAQDEVEAQRFYDCPVCRKPQLLDVDSLSVDPFLSSFIENLKVGAAGLPDCLVVALSALRTEGPPLACTARVSGRAGWQKLNACCLACQAR
jgi:hypothetical protein